MNNLFEWLKSLLLFSTRDEPKLKGRRDISHPFNPESAPPRKHHFPLNPHPAGCDY